MAERMSLVSKGLPCCDLQQLLRSSSFEFHELPPGGGLDALQTECSRCSPPHAKSCVKSLVTNVMVFGALMNEDSSLVRRDTRELASCLCSPPCEDTARRQLFINRKQAPTPHRVC